MNRRNFLGRAAFGTLATIPAFNLCQKLVGQEEAPLGANGYVVDDWFDTFDIAITQVPAIHLFKDTTLFYVVNHVVVEDDKPGLRVINPHVHEINKVAAGDAKVFNLPLFEVMAEGKDNKETSDNLWKVVNKFTSELLFQAGEANGIKENFSREDMVKALNQNEKAVAFFEYSNGKRKFLVGGNVGAHSFLLFAKGRPFVVKKPDGSLRATVQAACCVVRNDHVIVVHV